MEHNKELLLAALRAFIKQRAGLEFCNYATSNHAESVRAYRSEQRAITQDRHHAEALLAAVSWRDSITAEKILEASKRAFSGRLTIQLGARSKSGDFTPCAGFVSSETEELTHTACLECGYTRGQHAARLDYCTGQYFPTEYRKAVCAVLASALWDYFRDNMPEPDGVQERTYGDFQQTIHTYRGMSAGDYLRHTARRELPRTIAARYFN